MNCPNCGASMRLEDGKDFLSCDYCRSTHFPEKNAEGIRILAEDSGVECPLCAVPLADAALDAHRILYCPHCRGSLMPMAVFMFLVEDLRAKQGGAWEIPHPPDPKQLRRRIQCPRCHRPMDTHFYGGPGNIVIDDCSPCEVNWLDSGELMQVVRAPDHGAPGDGEP
jgi:Zn-finger nucleic acid-binding protein